MIAVKSTPEEWRKGGMRFYKKRLWVAAIHYRYFKTAIYVRHPRQNPPIFLPFCAMFLITKISLLGYYFLGFCSHYNGWLLRRHENHSR